MDVRAVAIGVPAAAAVLVALGLALAAGRRRAIRVPPPAVELLLRGTASALGDAALVFDMAGRLVWANDVAVALSPEIAEALLGQRPALGEDLATLRRGLSRGPAGGRVALRTRAGTLTAMAAALRVPGDAPVDVILLRPVPSLAQPEPALEVGDGDIVREPPPLPPAGAPAAPAATLAAQLGGMLARASSAVALLRMGLPSGWPETVRHIDVIEQSLRDAEAAVAALSSPIAPPVRRVVDVDALVSEALASIRGASGVEITHERRSADALADPAQLRQALRHVLQLAVARMPCGGTIAVRTRTAGGRVVIEIADSGASDGREPGLALPLAQRLVAAQGGTLELARTPGRGSRTRVTLPAPSPARAAGA